MSEEELIRDVIRKVPRETVESWLWGHQADNPDQIAWAEYVGGLLRKVASARFDPLWLRLVSSN